MAKVKKNKLSDPRPSWPSCFKISQQINFENVAVREEKCQTFQFVFKILKLSSYYIFTSFQII